MTDALHLAGLDHVEFYVADSDAMTEHMVAGYGFEVAGRSTADPTSHRTVALRQGGIVLAVTQGLSDEHPASAFVRAHGDGVANIVFRTPDVRAAFADAVAGGARPLAAPAEAHGTTTAAIEAFGDVRHTFVERSAGDPPGLLPPGVEPVRTEGGAFAAGLRAMDHIAVLVEAGRLKETVAFYESALGFRMIFEERFSVGTQGMNSQVVQNRAGDATFTIIEPDQDCEPGQIDDFVESHGGAGVQHLAFLADDIVRAVRTLQDHGVEFLTTPGTYYDLLPSRVDIVEHPLAQLRELGILADSDHAGQLFQIFTRSTHPRKTFFLEIIERHGAETFGRGNVRALYEAVELERTNAEPRP
ncbi:4-hydroxyphenylpyruvate dioxygenase [Streptomyces litchfieldiae]|uniref:4-hydroxyphenylpyruvate dioxygenase n=1 Tax=Streptomyces litchfieldiae TaxID=3075543 RepID=A0ABU2MQR1_9ACTN|nr:4-hydroxyphenylpyruvate dioxygenase [Streptomyces sp. DSM 44938]MDT0343967.1 4-hydroxyphenylpyruvate dioxygenase [Streptomyces sp. DSM 44938]